MSSTISSGSKVLIWQYEVSRNSKGVYQSFSLKKTRENAKEVFKYKAHQKYFVRKTEEEIEHDTLQQRKSFGTIAALQEVPPPSLLKERKISVGFKADTIEDLLKKITEKHPVSEVQEFQKHYIVFFHSLYHDALLFEE